MITPAGKAPEGPGNTLVGPFGISMTVIYVISFSVLLFYTLVKIWPYPTPSGTTPTTDSTTAAAAKLPQRNVVGVPGNLRCIADSVSRTQAQSLGDPSCVSVFSRTFPLWNEQRLLLIVILSGALGGLLHALRSLAWYVGNRDLKRSWLLSYVLLPFTAGAVAFVFYVVIRGGFFSAGSSMAQTSTFGFAALSVLVGMFSGPAVLKLKQVSETLLTNAEEGKDSTPPLTPATKPPDENGGAGGEPSAGEASGSGSTEIPLGHPVPVIRKIEPSAVVPGAAVSLTITGWNFAHGATVRVGQEDRKPSSRSATSVTVDLTKEDLSQLGVLEIRVVNPMPAGGLSKPRSLVIAAPNGQGVRAAQATDEAQS
jgi:hypothetical protein